VGYKDKITLIKAKIIDLSQNLYLFFEEKRVQIYVSEDFCTTHLDGKFN